jgi:outer membrane receptor protein involved in Fe transport
MLAIFVAQGGAARAQAVAANGAPPRVNTGIEEVVVTASKRSEKLQRLPQAIQVLDSKKLAQLQITEFQDYIKYIPSLGFQNFAPNQTTIYLRGVVDGGNANHSGPLPTVGSYLDEMPITTIGGTLDVHLYDIARIEVLPGPQGTLYGASSESGTVRFITNQPNPAKFEAGYSLETNILKNGQEGGIGEGFVNIPITDKIAVRLVGWDEHDAGYIDNVPATRTYVTSGATINNQAYVGRAFNPADTIGGRAALRVDLNEDWTITPSVVGQDQRNNGVFGFEPSVGDLEVNRFQADTAHDRWIQAAMNVAGRIGDYSLNYAGGFFVRDQVTQSDYTDYSIFYDQPRFGQYGLYWTDANNNPLANPSQEIDGKDHFTKYSNEIRLASPATDRFRFIIGAFQEEQGHRIIQDYLIQGLGPQITVPGWKNTLWLTDQQRTDRDYAAFGEVSYDITDKFTVLGGVRPYYYDNSLKGFFGFSSGFSSHTGVAACTPGKTFEDAPCVDLDHKVTGSGEVHKINLTYKIDPDKLVYFTYSTGFRPGGVNRRADQGAYQEDKLINFEVGFKSSWLDHRLTFNTALFDEDWNAFQFAYLGLNSFTIIKNAPSANIKGAEAAIEFRATSQLTFNGGLTLTDANLSNDFCTSLGTGSVAAGTVLSTCHGADVDPTSVASKGNALPYTPSVKGYATARYTFPVMDWDGYVQGDVSFQSRAQAALRDQDKQYLGSMPSYVVAGLSAGVTKNQLSLDLFIKNLTDERGEENRYTPCTIHVCAANVPGIPQAVYVVPVQPFLVGIRLSQKF